MKGYEKKKKELAKKSSKYETWRKSGTGPWYAPKSSKEYKDYYKNHWMTKGGTGTYHDWGKK